MQTQLQFKGTADVVIEALTDDLRGVGVKVEVKRYGLPNSGTITLTANEGNLSEALEHIRSHCVYKHHFKSS